MLADTKHTVSQLWADNMKNTFINFLNNYIIAFKINNIHQIGQNVTIDGFNLSEIITYTVLTCNDLLTSMSIACELLLLLFTC